MKPWTFEDEVLYATERVIFSCPEDPDTMLGQPIGMYHCPTCGCMCLPGLPHIHEFECHLGLWDGEGEE